jgi:cobalt/nickel transport system permease protein
MHIAEGVLSAPILVGGAGVALAGTAAGLKAIEYDRITRVGILSSAFFVASLIHVNVGPTSTHLILNGLLGLMLGWAAFPAILVALILQAFLFQYGGITVLGVNTVIMALPAVFCYYAFRPLLFTGYKSAMVGAFACGFGSVFLAALIMSLSLIFTEENFMEVAALVFAANLPVMVIEGIVTAFSIAFIKKVSPEMLPGYKTQSSGGQNHRRPEDQ